MTILYKLFGIPRTVDEFIDKAKNEGSDQVTVKVSDCNVLGGMDSVLYQCDINIQTDKRKLRINRRTCGALMLHVSAINATKTYRNSLEEAVKIAKKLKSYKLKTAINGNSIERIEEEIERVKI